jgi:hypothetical protein
MKTKLSFRPAGVVEKALQKAAVATAAEAAGAHMQGAQVNKRKVRCPQTDHVLFHASMNLTVEQHSKHDVVCLVRRTCEWIYESSSYLFLCRTWLWALGGLVAARQCLSSMETTLMEMDWKMAVTQTNNLPAICVSVTFDTLSTLTGLMCLIYELSNPCPDLNVLFRLYGWSYSLFTDVLIGLRIILTCTLILDFKPILHAVLV